MRPRIVKSELRTVLSAPLLGPFNSYGSRMVPCKKNILSGGRHLLCGDRHLKYGGRYLIIWRSPLNSSGGRFKEINNTIKLNMYFKFILDNQPNIWFTQFASSQHKTFSGANIPWIRMQSAFCKDKKKYHNSVSP